MSLTVYYFFRPIEPIKDCYKFWYFWLLLYTYGKKMEANQRTVIYGLMGEDNQQINLLLYKTNKQI